MTDRFKFRAYVEDFCFDDEDGNEYKKSLMFYGVTVYDCATVGISDDELEKQLKTQGFTDNEIEQFESCCSEYDGWFTLDVDFVEQCTGLKDRNGKLIFEGDILYCWLNRPRKVIVEFYRNAFCFNENGTYSEDIIFSDKCCEVIGNIHENPELLEGVK